MITQDQYFAGYRGHPGIQIPHRLAAGILLNLVNRLLDAYVADGGELHTNGATGCLIGGQKNGGWRPSDCKVGSAQSSHKTGRGVDIYDPFDELDRWLDDKKLAEFKLYREHPSETHTWVHLTDRPPASGKRTFMP